RLFYHTSSTQTDTHTAVQAHSPRSSHITLYHAHTHSLQGDTTYTHSTSRNTLDHTHTNTHPVAHSLHCITHTHSCRVTQPTQTETQKLPWTTHTHPTHTTPTPPTPSPPPSH